MKNKILVIKPPHRMFPLGMAYVLASLENHGIDFDFTDAEFGDEYKKLIKKNDYCAVATGGLISHFRFFLDVSRFVREVRPGTPIILGGGITKDLPSAFLFDKLHVTYGIVGEAETSFPFLVDALLRNKNEFETIPGLLHKDLKSGEIRKNPSRRFDFAAANILPAWHRFNVDYYVNNWDHGIFGHQLCMPVISARGCAGTCTFCSNLGGALRKRPIEQVVREIEILSERYAFDWIGFYNEMFYSTREEIVDFCKAMKSMKRRKKWSCDMRVDADVDVDTFRMMKDAGCVAVFGGLESGSNKILALMKKRTTREMIVRFYRDAEAAGLPCIGGMLIGNEGETEAELKETVDMVTGEKMRAVEALVCTYPGTKIFENAKKRGLVGDEWDYLECLDFFPDIWDYSKSLENYLNISDIPNDRFLKTAISQLRRFNTFNLTNFAPKNISCSPVWGMRVKMAGNCGACGSPVALVTSRRMLGLQTSCGNCFRPVEFNLYAMPEYADHYRYLCAELQKAKRLAIAGTKTEAMGFLKYDYFKVNYNSLTAFVEMEKKTSGVPDFRQVPRIRMDGLPTVNPDSILIVDDLFGDAELKLRNYYLKLDLQPPRILHLLPDEKRPYAGVLRLIRKHSSPTFGNKCLILCTLRIPLLLARIYAWFVATAKKYYPALVGNALVQMLLEKVRHFREA
jgi:radical SAM superfamily enzyme YgiQ (UPF0313 family)